jgi:hypothetical protein
MRHLKVVENGVEATKAIDEFVREGFSKDQVYLFAHDKERSQHLTEGTHTSDIGMAEQGIFDSMANVFRTRGDELRSKMKSLSITDMEADRLEKELDNGRVVVIANSRS